MNSEQARELLNRYWNCETSIEEEKKLRMFFKQKNVPEDLKKFIPLFRYFSEESKVTLSDIVERKIVDKLEKKNKSRLLPVFYKVAAAILLILSFYVIHQRFIDVKTKAGKVLTDTYSDPHKALEETRKILLSVSEKLNLGIQGAGRISKFNKAEEVIKNAKDKDI